MPLLRRLLWAFLLGRLISMDVLYAGLILIAGCTLIVVWLKCGDEE